MELSLLDLFHSLTSQLSSQFFTCFFNSIYSLNRDNLNGTDVNTVEALNELKLTFNKEDITIVKYVCHLVSDRAAILVSICKHN